MLIVIDIIDVINAKDSSVPPLRLTSLLDVEGTSGEILIRRRVARSLVEPSSSSVVQNKCITANNVISDYDSAVISQMFFYCLKLIYTFNFFYINYIQGQEGHF